MGVSEEEEKKKGMKKFLMRLELKISPTWKRNSLLSPRGTNNSIQDISMEKNDKTYSNQTNKDYIQRKNIKSSKGESTSNI